MAVPVNRSARWAAVAVLSVAGLALAGCSGDGGDDGPTSAASTASASPSASETAGGDSGSPSTSPSASPTGSYEPATSEGPAQNVPVPEMPDAVKEPTEEGLEAALEYWWETAYFLQLTGDPELFQVMSAEDCIICEGFVDNWDEIYGSGGWSTGAEAKIPESFVSLEDDSKSATMIFQTVEGPSSLYEQDGTEVGPEDAESTYRTDWSGSATFNSARGHWVINEIASEGDPVVE